MYEIIIEVSGLIFKILDPIIIDADLLVPGIKEKH